MTTRRPTSTSRGAAPASPPELPTRVPTIVGFAVGVAAFVAEFIVALIVGSADLSPLVPLAYLVFGAFATLGMGFAPSRPFQRGLTPGLGVALLAWLTLFDTVSLDVVIYLVVTIAGWVLGLELSRRRGRLPAELPPIGRRRQPGSLRRP